MARITPQRVINAARRGWEVRAWVRDNYATTVKALAGPYHGTSKAVADDADRQILNVLGTMCDTYLPNLLGHEFKVKCNPKTGGLAADALLRSLRLTQMVKDLKIAEHDERVVKDALLCGEGIWRIGLKAGADMIRADGQVFDPGEPFAVCVPPGQYTRDPLARHKDEVRFQGDRFIADRQTLLEYGIGDPDLVLSISSLTEPGEQRDPTSPVARGVVSPDDVISDDLIELWYLTVMDGTRLLECIVPNLTGFDQFLVPPQEYQGPADGPYECLNLYNHPTHPTGISMAQRLLDLHYSVADISRRAVSHILKTKRNMVYDGERGLETAMAITEALDDEPIQGDPNSVSEKVTGGLIDQFQRGLDVVMAMADNAGASLLQSSGRKGVADTATEASIIAGKAQGIMAMIKGPVNVCRTRVVERLSWYEDTAPARAQVYGVEAMPGVLTDVLYDPATRKGTFSSFAYDVVVYTPTTMDENTKLARLAQLISVMPPFIMFVAQLGGDVQAAMSLFTDDFPALNDVFPNPIAMMVAQQMMAQAGQGQPAGVRQVGGQQQQQMGEPVGAGSPMGSVTDGVGQMASDRPPM